MSSPAPIAKPALRPETSSADAITAIRGLIRRGQFLAAYDVAEETEVHPFKPAITPVALAEMLVLIIPDSFAEMKCLWCPKLLPHSTKH